MTRFERWAHYLSNLLVGVTGIVYAVMRYLLKPEQEWDVVNHPLQPHVQHLHLLVAPLLVFAVGLSWQRHILPRLRRPDLERYRSGLLLAFSLLPMVFSGYLIQVAVETFWRGVWVGVHLVTSALWTAGFVQHLSFEIRQGAKLLVGRRDALERRATQRRATRSAGPPGKGRSRRRRPRSARA